jgi:Rod binding domain-containing protein
MSFSPVTPLAQMQQPIAAPHAAQGNDAITKAAKSFTATALSEMLAPMFATLDETGGFFGGGPGEATWRPMLVQQFATSIAEHGGLGLTASVTQALLRLQEKST